jgi:hypothetical protein
MSAHANYESRVPPVIFEPPWEVTRAVVFGYWLLAISAGFTLFPGIGRGEVTIDVSVLFLLGWSVALHLFLLFKVEEGRNWARILHLALISLAAPGLLFRTLAAVEAFSFWSAIFIVHTGIQFYCVYLLLSRPANRWFSEQRKRATFP